MDRQSLAANRENATKTFADFAVGKPSFENLVAKHSKTLDSALSNIFPSKQEESRIEQARRIMGDDIKKLSDGDLEVFLTEFQYLIDCWLDEYEKQVFDNKTLKETLMEA